VRPRLSALIVDDERLARTELRRMLAAHPEIDVVGEAGDVAEAEAALARLSPDVVFLDIRMPGASGFDLVEKVPSGTRVVFVTAYSEFALRAFEANALDYLMKPVPPERLAAAVRKMLEGAPSGPAGGRPLHLDDPLIVPAGTHYRVVRVRQIVCLRAARDASEAVTADGRTTLVGRSLKEWEEVLPPRHFLRVHRSTIVNVDHVERIEPGFRVRLRGLGEPVEVSRRHAALLRERLV
jgi:two-component system LytT family response regulator